MFIRIASFSEAKKIVSDGEFPMSFEEFDPYRAGSVIFLLEIDNLLELSISYVEAIAESHNLEKGERLLLIKITNLDVNSIEIDKSQIGWAESRAYKKSIAIFNAAVVGYCVELIGISGNRKQTKLDFLDAEIGLVEYLAQYQ